MPAYNFQKRFVVPIRRGTKTNTIRRIGKRRHAQIGERIQLYTGMRTRHCKKIVADRICSRVSDIEITIGDSNFQSIDIDGVFLPRARWLAFAKRDGFESVGDFHELFKRMHGVGTFRGVLIQWMQEK
jgi:hypothetical protein